MALTLDFMLHIACKRDALSCLSTAADQAQGDAYMTLLRPTASPCVLGPVNVCVRCTHQLQLVPAGALAGRFAHIELARLPALP